MEPKKESVELTFEELGILKTALIVYMHNIHNLENPWDDAEYESADRLWDRLTRARLNLLEGFSMTETQKRINELREKIDELEPVEN